MRAWIVALMLLVPTIARAETDPWLGRDKMLHFGASAVLAGGGYALGAVFFDDRPARLASGAGLALGAGVAKELADLAGAGHPSWRDLAWDVVGTGAGLLVAWGIDGLFVAPASASGEPQTRMIALRAVF